MTRKGENIYKRKDGRWEGRYKKGRTESGKLKYGYVYGKKYTDVKEKLQKHKAAYQDIFEKNGTCCISYQHWAIKWLESRRKSIKSSTYSSYLYKLNHYVFPLIGEIQLNQLTKESIQMLINDLEKQNLQASTIHVLYQIVKKSLKDAYEKSLISRFPCQDIYLPIKKKKQPRALSRSEQRMMEETATRFPIQKGLPVILALNTGLRIGEISALQWQDIDFDTRVIHVRNTVQRIPSPNGEKKTMLLIDSPKTDKSVRTVPMGNLVYNYLKEWKQQSKSSYVCSPNAGPIEPRLINYYFDDIRSDCNLDNTHFHHLRHTFATRCIESSSDVASVSHLLGHSSSKTTLDVYTSSFFEERKKVIKQMEQSKE